MLLKNNIINVYKNLRIKSNQNLKNHLFDKVRQKRGGIEKFHCKYYTKNTTYSNKNLLLKHIKARN